LLKILLIFWRSSIPSVKLITPFIKWELIVADPDDNKFVDCAISAGAECIITHDAHFDILKTTPFPTVRILSPEEFKAIYELTVKTKYDL
jgi:predicted nucleic acid-binding protein